MNSESSSLSTPTNLEVVMKIRKKLQKEIERRGKLSSWEQFEIETADPMLFKVQKEVQRSSKCGA